jgi:hypothetical protein
MDGDLSIEELHQIAEARSNEHVRSLLTLARHHRRAAAEAKDGDPSIAKKLLLLASIAERDAALVRAEFEKRQRGLEKHRQRGSMRAIASNKRPGRANPMRLRICSMLATARPGFKDFKSFMRAWERDAMEGLRLHETSPGHYAIDDENAFDKPANYTRGTLEKLYSHSG